MLGYQTPRRPYVTFDANNLPVAGAAPATAQRSRGTVVLTSKTFGHLGGNSLTAQLVDPGGANNAPLSVSLAGNAIRVSLATNATGAITSTAAQVVAAINANPAVSDARHRVAVPHATPAPASSWPAPSRR